MYVCMQTPTTPKPSLGIVTITAGPIAAPVPKTDSAVANTAARPSTAVETAPFAAPNTSPAKLQIRFHDHLVHDAYSKKMKQTKKKKKNRSTQRTGPPRARLAQRTATTNIRPIACKPTPASNARRTLKMEQQLTPDNKDDLVCDAYCKKKKNRHQSAKSNRKLSSRLEAQ